MWVLRFLASSDGLSVTHAGSVIEVGSVCRWRRTPARSCPGVEVISCERRQLLRFLQVDHQPHGHLRRGRRVRPARSRPCGFAVDREARVAEVGGGVVVGVVGAGRVRVEQDRGRLRCGSPLVSFVDLVVLVSVRPCPCSFARARGVRRTCRSSCPGFGVGAVSGIFGGLLVLGSGLLVVGVPSRRCGRSCAGDQGSRGARTRRGGRPVACAT